MTPLDPSSDNLMMRRGRLVATVLSGAWRAQPNPLVLSLSDLACVAPILLRTGTGSLAWWRTSQGGHRMDGAPALFRQANLLHTLEANAHEDRLRDLLRRMYAGGVEPLLNKGWSMARSYPRLGLRPYGDIDLCVRPDQLPVAINVLKTWEDRCWVDLHRGVPELGDRSWEEINARAVLVPLGEISVRCLGPEDQFRLLCLHLARHGAWRPLWLCDIAAMLELLPATFDWDCCLAGPCWLSDWVICVAVLATELLGAQWDAGTLPLPPLPDWVVLAVLRQWGSEVSGDSHTRDDLPIRSHFRRPVGLFAALHRRWPNPIEAAMRMQRSPRTSTPRVLLQAFAWLERGLSFARRTLGLAGRRNQHADDGYQMHPIA